MNRCKDVTRLFMWTPKSSVMSLMYRARAANISWPSNSRKQDARYWSQWVKGSPSISIYPTFKSPTKARIEALTSSSVNPDTSTLPRNNVINTVYVMRATFKASSLRKRLTHKRSKNDSRSFARNSNSWGRCSISSSHGLLLLAGDRLECLRLRALYGLVPTFRPCTMGSKVSAAYMWFR